MAGIDPTKRFSSRVEDYVRYRPSYPAEILPLLERECGLNADSTVADVGSGTGFLTKFFLDLGCRVIGVEPNAEMRRAGDEFLAGYERFTSVAGRAEETGLPDASIDLVTAGQAFHWFDADAARSEFVRILRAPCWVALVWNEREVQGAFLEGYEDLLLEYAPDYAKVDHRQIDADRIAAFLGHDNWKLATFANAQEFDLDGVRGRLRSSSYAPREGDPGYEAIAEGLDRLFETQAVSGRVSFLYRTNLYYGTL